MADHPQLRPVLVHDHDVLVETLVYHQRKDDQYCLCGWGELGRSHAEHVAAVYEQALTHG